jgi:hypothetical protein
LILHFVTPAAVVTQQVTAAGLPHTEREAQRCTKPLQRGLSCPSAARVRSTSAEHRT